MDIIDMKKYAETRKKNIISENKNGGNCEIISLNSRKKNKKLDTKNDIKSLFNNMLSKKEIIHNITCNAVASLLMSLEEDNVDTESRVIERGSFIIYETVRSIVESYFNEK